LENTSLSTYAALSLSITPTALDPNTAPRPRKPTIRYPMVPVKIGVGNSAMVKSRLINFNVVDIKDQSIVYY